MPEKKIIKAGSITNLTDARFFAAYDVDYIGFCFDPLSPDYISPQNALAIKGWISGPKIVAEFANQDLENVKNIISFFEPDIVECELRSSDFKILNTELHFILKISGNDLNEMHEGNCLFYLTDDINIIQQSNSEIPFMLDITGKEINLSDSKIKAIQIKGSQEIEVGVKDYDAIADLLEQLNNFK